MTTRPKPVEAWVAAEWRLHDGLCVLCQRHFKSAYNWASHIAGEHPHVWERLDPRWPG